jgi:DNA-binding response OmpR family regulator
MANDLIGPVSSNGANHVVLIVEDYWDARPELKHVLKQKGYRVIDTDNGRDAAREARQTHPDLLLVDIDVPPIYGLVAARLIIKRAHVSPMPVVFVTHEDVVDRGPLMELGVSRNEYVTRLSDYEELQYLLDYLLPVLPQANDVVRESEPSQRRVELFAHRFWQRARQNCIHVEMPGSRRRDRLRANPFTGLAVISFNRRPLEVPSGLCVHTQIIFWQIFPAR